MFCLCCNSPTPVSASRFFAEGLTSMSSDMTSALQRRAAYERRKAYSRAPVSRPAQIEMIIRHAQVLTMDDGSGERPVADIHIRDGEIVTIGKVDAVQAMLEIDGRGHIAMPGRAAAHRHLVGDSGAVHADGVGDAQIYRIVRTMLLDLMAAGVTCVDQCACDLSVRAAEPALLAQIDSGLRGRFSYLSPQSEAERAADELAERWPPEASDHRIDVDAVAGRCHGPNEAGDVAGLVARMHDASVGSLAPGGRADLILVDPARSRHLPDAGPDAWAAGDLHADNVVLVCADGRLLKRNGVVTEPNEGLIRQEGRAALLACRDPDNHQSIRS